MTQASVERDGEDERPMHIATGIDLTEIALVTRLLERHGQRFLERVYTPYEQNQGNQDGARLACLFAAKEATAKALGAGLSYLTAAGVDLREIEIVCQGWRGNVRLYGAAKARAAALGLETWTVSLARSRTYALAMALAWRGQFPCASDSADERLCH